MKYGSCLAFRILAALGFVISAYLFWQKAIGNISSIAGCGSGSDCSNVLGSRWSQVVHIPVSALSALFYAGLLLASLRPRPMVLVPAAMVLLGVAAWFMGLQVFVLDSLCPWCLTTHLIGVSCAVVILTGIDPRPDLKTFRYAVLIGGNGVGLLILAQVFGPQPETHLLTEENSEKEVAPVPEEVVEVPLKAGRTVTFFEGKKVFEVGALPHLGNPEAPHVLVKYFDYTCKSCRDQHGDLKALQKAFPGQVVVIVLPCPLHRSCNPYLGQRVRNHEGACEIARLALAAWLAKPEVFEQVHDALFATFTKVPEEAREVITHFVAEEDLAQALQDPWVEERLQTNLIDFRSFVQETDRMPKLLVRDSQMMHGLSRTTEVFVQVISERLGLQRSR